MDQEATEARWQKYYAQVSAQPHRKLTAMAVKALAPALQKTAVDCGCGTGSDIAYLLEQGFDVQGFDIREEPLDVCRQRFSGCPQLRLTQADFMGFEYSPVSLIVANSSLFFCPQPGFPDVWQRMMAALPAGGIFSGDLLGVNDSWVNSPDHDVSAFTAAQVDELFTGFEIICRNERDEPGQTALGRSKHWHMHTVIARKLA
ncbi:class I SAM-dependent methyltransferase [Aliamphritea hakodatensis]|uniref:class I SAM-dependent methyltransferase n=1 Tax=Aliamphritea hakodatensis TaxID=2895352 RepID=UPI0022FD4BE5|nr:class I SAM-dependent methyltransferase [Aliamphritea hakodatensis]